MSTILDGFRKDIVEHVDVYNKALAKNDFAAMSRIEAELKESEAGYAEAKSVEVFSICKKTENPVLKAIEVYDYPIVTHRVVREDGKVTGFEVAEDRRKQIDLVKLCKFCDLDYLWQYKVEKFNQLLCLRAANELKMSKAQVRKICDSFYMDKLAQREKLGETPDSNTQICKQLQMVLDAILFVDNGGGKNTYRVNTHDVAYLLMCYTKRGRKALTVAIAKNTYVHRLVMDVAHRIVTGKQYDLEYRMITEKSDVKAEPAKSPAKKAVVAEETDKVDTVKVPKAAKSAKAPKATEPPAISEDELPSIEDFVNGAEATKAVA